MYIQSIHGVFLPDSCSIFFFFQLWNGTRGVPHFEMRSSHIKHPHIGRYYSIPIIHIQKQYARLLPSLIAYTFL